MAQAGDRIGGRYELIRELGQGGMGSVWEAEDGRLGRRVAVKTVLLTGNRDQPTTVTRFRREARIAANLQHPGIAAIHDFGDDRDALYLVMELLPGRDLAAELASGRAGASGAVELMPVGRAVRILRRTAVALGHAHDRGVVHRDLKPANIMITDQGEPKICDFGIARSAELADGDTLRESGVPMGTPAYMSPEQTIGKEVDHRTDLYALGCIGYELLVGRPPFLADTVWGILLQQRRIAPAPPTRPDGPLPDRLTDLVLRLLAKDPEQRPAHADEVVEALAQVMESGRGALPGVGGASGGRSR
ncbi:serine/threonine-protein kinase [Kitasatospora sp. NPDC093806]|uniref:serine/threonine-protein kinase n=1 Tax=Kitasatospora sp. NPDC093806 TaxID=3155075 RepID=UPI00343A4B88